MTPRQQRMLSVGLIVAGISIAATFIMQAMSENMMYFVSPTEVVEGSRNEGEKFRLGGLVVDGSFQREPGSLEATFQVTDNQSIVTVSYTGVLPDLFKEGQGMIARGALADNGVFVAEEVLAKHDENYMSPEVAKMLEKQGHPGTPTAAMDN